MSIQQLFAEVPWPLVISFLTATAIPYLSALATKRPGWWTGAVTILLSFGSAFLAELAAQGTGHYNWRVALGFAFANWAAARLTHNTTLKGTPTQAQLHAVGSKTAP